jgi:hypothetical protein
MKRVYLVVLIYSLSRAAESMIFDFLIPLIHESWSIKVNKRGLTNCKPLNVIIIHIQHRLTSFGKNDDDGCGKRIS